MLSNRSIFLCALPLTVATFFTVLRIAITPFIVLMMIAQEWGFAFLLLLIAAGTDMVDGFIARSYNQKTWLGALLDPIADKCLVLSVFFTLTLVQSPLFSIPLWFVLIVFCKELLLLFGSFAIYWCTGSLTINPSWLGKLAMFLQISFIIWLFACYYFHWVPVKTYYTMLGLIVLCAIASLVHYSFIAFRYCWYYLL